MEVRPSCAARFRPFVTSFLTTCCKKKNVVKTYHHFIFVLFCFVYSLKIKRKCIGWRCVTTNTRMIIIINHELDLVFITDLIRSLLFYNYCVSRSGVLRTQKLRPPSVEN